MNETIRTIKNRTSTRKYKEDPIDKDQLEAIIEAGLYAPNGMNHQKWHFTVVQDKKVMDKIIQTIKRNIIDSGIESLAAGAKNPEFNPFYGAPVLVILSADKNSKFMQIDCGAAGENMAVAAESLGIGSCFIASSVFVVSNDKGSGIKKELGIPENNVPVISLVLGYKADRVGEMATEKRRDESVVNYI